AFLKPASPPRLTHRLVTVVKTSLHVFGGSSRHLPDALPTRAAGFLANAPLDRFLTPCRLRPALGRSPPLVGGRRRSSHARPPMCHGTPERPIRPRHGP